LKTLLQPDSGKYFYRPITNSTAMIPAEKQPAVEEALLKTFGVHHPDDIQPMTKGLSGSLVFKISIRGKDYLMRVIPEAVSRDNPAYYFECMQAAADAKLAPAIHYVNIEDRICITDSIAAQPFPIAKAVTEMADAVNRLHGLPRFANTLPYLAAADGFFEKFRQRGQLPEAMMQLLVERYARISAIYPRNDQEDMVSSHNDLKPDNIIWDGAKAWLVDWEAARLNDRYVDLASIANFVVKCEADERELLECYFGAPPTEYHRARFFLMSNILHVFCLAICSMPAAQGRLLPIDAARPEFNEYHQLLWEGKINLGDPEEKLRYGLVHLDAFLRKTGSDRFLASIRTVEAGAAN
jgi:aminoglycoside phosphotransferase (APT) family kinase protein